MLIVLGFHCLPKEKTMNMNIFSPPLFLLIALCHIASQQYFLQRALKQSISSEWTKFLLGSSSSQQSFLSWPLSFFNVEKMNEVDTLEMDLYYNFCFAIYWCAAWGLKKPKTNKPTKTKFKKPQKQTNNKKRTDKKQKQKQTHIKPPTLWIQSPLLDVL